MPLKYGSGEEIQPGDQVVLHGEPGEIEFVVESLAGDPEMDWYIRELGPGVMVREPKQFGTTYIRGGDSVTVPGRRVHRSHAALPRAAESHGSRRADRLALGST